MKKFIIIITALFTCASLQAQPPCIPVAETQSESCGFTYCGPYELSDGIYRVPYLDGTTVFVNNDHFKHCPRASYDMNGINGAEYFIVAAADGWIRTIVDNNTEACEDCSCPNNYLWIEHPNGEWSKYTHMETSSPTNLGHFAGEWVTAGTVLGEEGTVGCSSGNHLHFEVARPVAPETVITGQWGYENVIPVICGIQGNIFEADGVYVAGDCPSACGEFLIPFPQTFEVGDFEVVLNDDEIENSADVTFESWSAALLQAGNEIVLKDGFWIQENADFTARIGDCDEFSPRTENNQLIMAGDDITSETKMKIYPNPSSGITNLEFVLTEESWVTVQLQDLTGRVVSDICENKLLEKGLHRFTLQAADFPGGSYLCVADIGGNKVVSKVVVQH